MEARITVQNNQSVFDLGIQLGGSIEAAVDVAKLLGISLTDDVPVGTIIETSSIPIYNREVLEHYYSHSIIPATAHKMNEEIEVVTGGIGYMAIGSTFIVG